MSRIANLHGLFIRTPSLKGHRVVERLGSSSRFVWYRVQERASLVERDLFLTRSFVSSSAHLAELLTGRGVAFEVRRLRNGGVGFCSQPNVFEQRFFTLEAAGVTGRSNRSPNYISKLSRRNLLLVSAGGLAVAAMISVSIGVTEPALNARPDPVLSDKLPTIQNLVSCDQTFLQAESLLVKYLSGQTASDELAFKVLSTTQIGGLRQLDVSATCASPKGSPESKRQTWQVALSKIKDDWKPIKMTRLDN